MKNVIEYHAAMQAATRKWEAARDNHKAAKEAENEAWVEEQNAWNDMADLMVKMSHEIEEGKD